MLEGRVKEQQPATPQTVDKLLEAGFQLFRHGFKDILGILIAQTISMLALFVVLFAITISLTTNMSPDKFEPGVAISLILSSLLVLTVQLGFIAAFTAKFWAISHDKQISSAHAYAVGFKKAIPLLLWLMLYLLIVAVGLVLLVVPGLVLLISLFMGAGLIIQDHISILEAIKMSHRMVRPYLRRTLLYLSFSLLITIIAYFATVFPLGIIISYLTSNQPMLSGIFVPAKYALIVILVPLFVSFMIPYFRDLRHRM